MTEPLRVLIVEDEAVILMQIELMLAEAGHSIVGTAMSAKEALALVEERKPELLLLDLYLQDGSSGLDVARVLRDRDDLTIVFLTANVGKLSGDMEGAAAAIAKPFNEQTLGGSIAYLEECVHRPPPLLDLPHGMQLAPDYVSWIDGLRLDATHGREH